MSTFTCNVEYPEQRNRMTVAFRIILAIPRRPYPSDVSRVVAHTA